MLASGHEIPTIDVVLVTITPASGGDELAIKTNTQIQVTPQIETRDAIRLVKLGRLLAQKPVENTIVGNTIVLTDCVFIPELAVMLQGGTIVFDEDEPTKIVSYTPPVAGSDDKGEIFVLKAYSAIYNAAGIITGYEVISYPNCQGTPFGLTSQDDVFRVPQYTVNSAPDVGESPYNILYVAQLPEIDVPDEPEPEPEPEP